jgi:hypothetical protein
MSGGRFDYVQYRFLEIVEYIEKEIEHNNAEPGPKDFFEPNNFSDETIVEFKKGVEAIKKAYTYAQRIDWLLSGDEGEEAFHKKLKKELGEQ